LLRVDWFHDGPVENREGTFTRVAVGGRHSSFCYCRWKIVRKGGGLRIGVYRLGGWAAAEQGKMLDASVFVEAFRYFAAFWYFAFQPEYRRECGDAWRKGGALRRGALIVHAIIAIVCGLGPLGLLVYCGP
jgi:hypothetical protein